jgi:hypothetical protein
MGLAVGATKRQLQAEQFGQWGHSDTSYALIFSVRGYLTLVV